MQTSGRQKRDISRAYTKPGNGMKTLVFDVMLKGRFVCTLRMKYCPLFPLTVDEICEFVESKRPTLKGKKYNIEF